MGAFPTRDIESATMGHSLPQCTTSIHDIGTVANSPGVKANTQRLGMLPVDLPGIRQSVARLPGAMVRRRPHVSRTPKR